MARNDGLAGIAAGLKLANTAMQLEAASAFLQMLVAKTPYPPQVDFCNSWKKIVALFGANQSGKCLRAESQVLMADQGLQMIKDLTKGDQVMAYDFHGAFVPATVTGVFQNDAMQVHRFLHPMGILECSRSHKVATINNRTGRTSMVRVMRAVRDQLPVILRGVSGAPVLGFLQHEGFAVFEPTWDISIDHPDHAFVCNDIVVSNSHTAAYNMAWDLTGLYPEWYQGQKTVRGINAWVIGDTAENTRDACQRKLFGPDDKQPGWTDQPGISGLIAPAYIVGQPSKKSVSGCFDTVRVKHVPSDTTSIVSFKSHQMDVQSLASWAGDRVWIDEEAPLELLMEMIARISVAGKRGQIYITLCPQHGITPLVKFLQDNAGGPDVFLNRLGYDDVGHLSAETKEANMRLYAHNPAELAARTQGLATSNAGLIFPFPASQITYNPKKIGALPRWKYLGGLDVGFRWTGATACAWDPFTDIIYVYATYEMPDTDYMTHHANLNRWGSHLRFMIDPASNQASQADGTKILEKYWTMAHGENWDDIEEPKRKYVKANNSFPVGQAEMWHRFKTGRLLIDQTLSVLLSQHAQFEWNKDGDGPVRQSDTKRFDVIKAAQYMVMGVPDNCFRLDDTPPWLEADWQAPIDIPTWNPYRSGRNGEE